MTKTLPLFTLAIGVLISACAPETETAGTETQSAETAATETTATEDAGTETAEAVEPITAAEVEAAQQAWGEGIVAIGQVHTEGGDVEAAARDHIEQFYAYGERPVLFKPTLASDDQFRGTFDEALSYFVGGSIEEDGGFALAPYTNVRWENEGVFLDENSAMAMGNYFFTTTEGDAVKVEYSFGYERGEDGDLKIVLHHSSLPYSAQ
ncbi:MAG: phosphoribosyl-AMP cyclohydrolase [Oceanicaulis sp.]